MDDYDIELTPNDPEFGPDECESAYALWAFKEDGEHRWRTTIAAALSTPCCATGTG